MPRCGSSQFQKSFAARTITEKNSLPDSITLLATVPSFRSQLSAISCLQACTLHCCNIHQEFDNYHLDPDYRSLLLSTDGNDRKIDMLCDLASSNSCCLHHRRTSQEAGGAAAPDSGKAIIFRTNTKFCWEKMAQPPSYKTLAHTPMWTNQLFQKCIMSVTNVYVKHVVQLVMEGNIQITDNVF